MSWILLAISAYFLLSIESVANKFLISGKVGSWKLYLFYIGILSFFSLALAPFGLQWPGMKVFLLTIFAGIVFFGYLAFLFWSLKGTGATRVFVLIGSVSTIATVLLSHLVLSEKFGLSDIFGIALLLLGGIVISLKAQEGKFFKDYKKVVIAGILLAFSMILLKYVYGQQNFISGYVFSRFGITAMALSLLLLPSYRKTIFSQLKKRKKKDHASNFGAVVGVKALAGIATVIREYSIAIGSVAIVSALASVQYLFVFIISTMLAIFFSKIFKESLDRKNLILKSAGSILVVLGVALVML